MIVEPKDVVSELINDVKFHNVDVGFDGGTMTP